VGLDVYANLSYGVVLDEDERPLGYKDEDITEEKYEELWGEKFYDKETFVELIYTGGEGGAVIIALTGYTIGADWWEPEGINPEKLWVPFGDYTKFREWLREHKIDKEPAWCLSAYMSH